MKIRQTTTCHTCRARKLACDGKVPACSQCVHSGRACAGYQHDLIFRPPVVSGHHPAPTRATKRRRISPPVQQQRRLVHRSGDSNGSSVESEDVEQHPSQRPNPVSPSLSWPLLDIISLVIQNFTPSELLDQPQLVPSASVSSTDRVCGAWVETLPELARNTQTERFLSPAIKTLAVSILSRGSHGRAPISDALVAHTSALSSLRSGLWDADASSSNPLLAAAMCLLLSETFLPTSETSGLIHAKGVGNLLQLQGPRFYSTGVAHKLFVGFRPILFTNLFLSHQNAFIAEDQWLTAPFSISAAAPLQKLFSELMNLPLTMETVTELQGMSVPKAEAAANAAFADFKRSLLRLLDLIKTFKNDPRGQYFPQIYGPENRKSLPFPDISVANFLTHAWALHIVCAQHITHLVSLFPYLDECIGPDLKKLVTKQMVNGLACQIFRSTEFLTRDKFKLFGAASTILPLHVACGVLKGQGKDNEDLWYWYHEVVRISSMTGYNFMSEKAMGC